MTTADRQQLPSTSGTFRFSLRGLMLFTTAIAVVFAAGHYFGDIVYIPFGFIMVLIVPGFAIELLRGRRTRGVSSKFARWSLAGVISLIHLSVCLAAVWYAHSLEGPGGGPIVDDATRPTVEFLRRVWLVLYFPIGWFGLFLRHVFQYALGINLHFDIVFLVFMAANSAVVGLVLAGFVKFVCRKAGWVTEPSSPDVPPACSA
jgi:hypothetical protein